MIVPERGDARNCMKLENIECIKMCKNKILSFCASHKRIYLYGAGMYGKIYYAFWKNRGLPLEGVITTNGNGSFENTPAYRAVEILPELGCNDGIVLSVKEELQEEILKSQSFYCDILRLTKLEYGILCVLTDMSVVYKISEKYPCKKDIGGYNFKSILIVQLEVTFGDMIWSTAFVRELRRNFPDSHISMVMNDKFIPLYDNCSYLDDIYGYDCSSLNDKISDEMADKAECFCRENLYNKQYDAVFLPRQLPTSNSDALENVLVAMMSGARYRFAHGMGVMERNKLYCGTLRDSFTDMRVHSYGEHEAKYDLSLIELIGGIIRDDRMELWTGDEDRAFAQSVLDGRQSPKYRIAVALVGREERRSWNPEKYNKVFHELVNRYGKQVCFVLLGGGDAKQAAVVAKDGIEECCIDLVAWTSLNEAAAVIEKCDMYLGSDTGLLHMASSFGKPVIEISACIMNAPDYWGSNPTRTGAWKVPNIVLRPNKALGDCKYVCYSPHRHCIDQITEEHVLEAVEEMLSIC